jgi:acetone monooxygenase
MRETKTNDAHKHESLEAGGESGRGVAGLYQLYRERDEQEPKAKAVDTATGVGGTRYSNRYPGRFDSEAYVYQDLFSEELNKGEPERAFPGSAGDLLAKSTVYAKLHGYNIRVDQGAANT